MGQCAHKIIKDGSCVNQNIVKQNMETRSNYLLKKKGTEKEKKKARIEADQVPLTALVQKDKKQLRLEAIGQLKQ